VSPFVGYIETLSGEQPDLVRQLAPSLPLYLREQYELYLVRLFGRESLLAFQGKTFEGITPVEYRKHEEILSHALGKPVILVLPALPSFARNRMVQMGVPFVVPGNQAFIPASVIDLRERFPRGDRGKRESLTPAAQLTLLFHLIRGRVDQIPLKDVAQRLGVYSPMMITKVKDEFEAAGICSTTQSGRHMLLDFAVQGRELWEFAKPQLTSPVKKVRWVRWENPGYPALLSGMSALSRRTMIADDRLSTYALGPRMLESWLEKGFVSGCPDSEQATARIEVWSYEPKLLSNNESIDPLSLYLSLRDSADERVHQQLEQLIEEVQW